MNKLGKRYRCQVCGTEALCTKAGEGAVVCCGKEMEIQQPKPLPSSDQALCKLAIEPFEPYDKTFCEFDCHLWVNQSQASLPEDTNARVMLMLLQL